MNQDDVEAATGRRRPLSLWLRGLTMYLGWSAARAVFVAILGALNPEMQSMAETGLGPVATMGPAIYGILGLGAAVALTVRHHLAFPLTLTTLAFDASTTLFELWRTTADPAAVRAAYAANRAARGLPLPAEQLELMFSPEAITVMWVIGGIMVVVPTAILLWRKHELPTAPPVRDATR